jgi:hypothetical protein
MRIIRSGIGWLLTLGALSCAMTIPAGLARALEYGGSPSLICADNKQSAEVGASHMPLEPANGATVPAGTPVTFSGESTYALTFSVASSEALLSSPDIDGGAGSQSGALYEFASTKATATPRTVYWTASFTFTPGDCESPSTFTTPVRTLIVAPTEAELAATKMRQEEEAARKNLEAEAAAKKKEEEAAAAASVVLDGLTVDVENSREAAVKLTCSDVATCAGKLTLTARGTTRKDRKTKAKATAIGTARFSIPAGKTTTVELALNAAGRALLGADHGRLSASLTVLRSSPAPSQTHTESVQLVQEKVVKGTKRKR